MSRLLVTARAPFLALLSSVSSFGLASLLGAQVPDGLSGSDWSSIRAASDAGRHRAFAVAGGFRARNPGQQWSTRFDGRGFDVTPDAGGWSWGLELVRYGFGDDARAVDRPVSVAADGGRVEYAWDDRLTEWYVNDRRGLEHGYTVKARPAGARGALGLALAVRGGLCAEVSASGRDVSFTDAAAGAALTYAGLVVRDAEGRELSAGWTAVGRDLHLSVDDAGARYPLTVDPIAQQAYLKASNTGANDGFGSSVAISGNTVVVGAPNEASNATGVNGDESNNDAPSAGAAYVFVRSGATWSQQAYLKASNTEAYDGFGGVGSVSVSGDTIVVGAQGEDSSDRLINGNQSDNSASNSGAAYVFVRNGTTWTQQAYLKAPNGDIRDTFGKAVSVSGNTAIVTAPQEDSNAIGVNGNQFNNLAGGSGAAYVFVRNGTTWSFAGYLKASNTETGDEFGYSLSLSGDTVVIGAWQEDGNATGVNGAQNNNFAIDSGAAYVFLRSGGGGWSQQAYLKASNNEYVGGDRFGVSVSISGDTVVVGANQEDSASTGVNGGQANNSATSAGAAYVFARSGSTWSQQAYLKASNTEALDYFGAAVSCSGDTVVVGAHSEDGNSTGLDGNQSDNGATDSGAVYVFTRIGTTWSQQAYVKASNTGADDRFGNSVALAEGLAVVGAVSEDSVATGVDGDQSDNSGGGAGAAYVFTIRPDTFGCATPATGYGPPTLAITSGAPRIGTTFDLTIANPSPTALASSLGFELFIPPALAPQSSIVLFGFCWNLPLTFAATFVPIPTPVVLPLTMPMAPAMVGTEIDWQVLAIDPASASTELAITASRGLTTRIAM